MMNKTQDLRNCPLCKKPSVSAISGSQYCKCPGCGIIYNARHTPLDYGDGYFTTDYTAQYGKTYEEDFPSIYAQSLRRVHRAKKLLTFEPMMSALDIGAAMGFFLKAAQDSGFTKTEGVEISAFASKIARSKFGISLYNTPFDQFNSTGQYHLVTAWYFLEHIADTLAVLEKLTSFVRPGGVLAFSVPSWNGPAFKYHTDEWIQSHPVDHRVDFSPQSVKCILRKLGYKHVHVYPAGIHPERVVKKNSPVYPIFSPLYRIISHLTAFSDTIEVYAQKTLQK